MFMADEETRSLWFNPSAPEDLDREYTLIGMLLGLAIYNSIILDIKFPPVLYRKLMGKVGTFEDLETSHPVRVLHMRFSLLYELDLDYLQKLEESSVIQ
jgi:ubiquitin-protein ligase E3 A